MGGEGRERRAYLKMNKNQQCILELDLKRRVDIYFVKLTELEYKRKKLYNYGAQIPDLFTWSMKNENKERCLTILKTDIKVVYLCQRERFIEKSDQVSRKNTTINESGCVCCTSSNQRHHQLYQT